MVLCYNNGCGRDFDEHDDGPSACTFHPGSPYFHDAYKGWSCCNRRCIDFTEFLNMKGCAVGPHNPVKPAAEPKSLQPGETDTQNNSNVDAGTRVAQSIPRSRPESTNEMIHLKQKLASNLSKIKLQEPELDESLLTKECSHGGCSTKYGERESNPVCTYHSGSPIFHEGLKYWSCCKKKTMEFEEFMKQKGCVKGEHCWFSERKVSCRFDWHQTATQVIVTIYSKGYDFNVVQVKANAVKLSVDIGLPDGKFNKEWILTGIIDEENSVVELLTTKVEIKLRKAEPMHWLDLELSSESQQPEGANNVEDQIALSAATELDDI